MFEFFRKGVASIFAGVLLALLIASFALWGIGDPMSTLGSNDVAEVGDEKITRTDYARAFDTDFQQTQQRFGQSFTRDAAVQFGFGNQVVTRIVERKAYDVEAKNLGLRATDQELRDYIMQISAFQNPDGSFNRAVFEQFANAQGRGVKEFENLMRADLVRTQLINGVLNNVKAPDIATTTLNKYASEERIAEILTIPASSMTTTGEPTEEDIQKQYDENPDNYMAPEYRDISYFEISTNDFMDQVEITDDQALEDYERRIIEFTKEEERSFIQMLFDDETAANVAFTELENGKSFEEVLTDQTGESAEDYTFEAQTLGDISDVYGDDVADQIFTTELGQYTSPIETGLGVYVFKVASVNQETTDSFDDVKEQIISELKADEALRQLYDLTDKVQDEVAAGAVLNEIASVLSLNLIQIKNVNEEGLMPDGNASGDLPLIVDFLLKAFEQNIGDELELYEGISNKFYMLSVNNIVDSKLRELTDVREQVIADWTQGRRETLASELATRITDEYSSEESTEKLLVDYQGMGADLVVNRVTVDRENIENNVAANIHASIFSQNIGGIEMIPAADNNGFVLVRVNQRMFGEVTDETELAQIKDRINGSYQSDVMSAFTRYLYESLPITINQATVQATLDAIAAPDGL